MSLTKKDARILFDDANLARYVDNGVRLLDYELGPDWPHLIELNRLNMAAGGWCVLGQLYGTYTHGKWKLGLFHSAYDRDGYEHGFYIPRTDAEYHRRWYPRRLRDRYAALTKLWEARIKVERAKLPVSA
jgi:hypothetical protein